MVDAMSQARLVGFRNLFRRTIDRVRLPKNRDCCVCYMFLFDRIDSFVFLPEFESVPRHLLQLG
jgi:hypothetical protein